MAVPYKNQMNQYKRMKIETASPEMLILMLYDGAIKNIKISIQSLEQEQPDYQNSSNCLIKAQNIITELMVSLNFEIGGEIARNLFNIYEYINYTLAQCNVNKNNDNLDTIIAMLSDLRETWKEVIRINKEKYPNGIPRALGETSTEQNEQNQPPLNAESLTPTNATLQAPPTDRTDSQANLQLRPSPINQPLNNNQQTNRQANRFRQAYGKHMPQK